MNLNSSRKLEEKTGDGFVKNELANGRNRILLELRVLGGLFFFHNTKSSSGELENCIARGL